MIQLHPGREASSPSVEPRHNISRKCHSADWGNSRLVSCGVEPAGTFVRNGGNSKAAVRRLSNGGPSGGTFRAGIFMLDFCQKNRGHAGLKIRGEQRRGRVSSLKQVVREQCNEG